MHILRFRVNPTDDAAPIAFELAPLPGETVGALKVRVSARATAVPDPWFFALYHDARPLKVAESVSALLDDTHSATFDVAWNTCSHGAPAHPVTGLSTCFWDGSGPPTSEPEY